MIHDGTGPVEAECQSCEGLGVIWPPGTTAVEAVPYFHEDMWSYNIPSGGKVSVSGLFGWDTSHTNCDKVSLSLVTDKDED
jgi:hypothetical protein